MILDMTRSHIWTQIAEATKNIAIVGRYRIISPNTAPFSAEKRGQKHVYLFTLIHDTPTCIFIAFNQKVCWEVGPAYEKHIFPKP